MQRGFYAILSQSSLTGWVGTLTNTWAGAESLWRWRVLHNWKSRCQLCAVQQRKCKKNVRLSYDIRRCSWRTIKASTEWQEHSTPSNLIKAINMLKLKLSFKRRSDLFFPISMEQQAPTAPKAPIEIYSFNLIWWIHERVAHKSPFANRSSAMSRRVTKYLVTIHKFISHKINIIGFYRHTSFFHLIIIPCLCRPFDGLTYRTRIRWSQSSFCCEITQSRTRRRYDDGKYLHVKSETTTTKTLFTRN